MRRGTIKSQSIPVNKLVLLDIVAERMINMEFHVEHFKLKLENLVQNRFQGLNTTMYYFERLIEAKVDDAMELVLQKLSDASHMVLEEITTHGEHSL
jgi:hypothetical protein